MNKYQTEKLINNISMAIDKSLRERGFKIRSNQSYEYTQHQYHRECPNCETGSGQYYRKLTKTWRCMFCETISKGDGRI